MPPEKISAIIHILEVCASYDYLKTLTLQRRSIEENIHQYILEHLQENLSVAHLADLFHLSRMGLYELFKQSFDSSVAEFIKKCRMEKASVLLLQTNLPVRQVAEQVGIPDYNYFTKVFKSIYQMTPSAYRKAHHEPPLP